MDGSEKRIAVLIDAENIASKYISIILKELASEGIVTYKRVYGDWTKSELSPWKEVMVAHSVLPIHQFSYTTGKGSTDSAMIIDAMDILYSGKVDGFCLVSSDSDYTRLSARLRESGMMVIGMGEAKTPSAFRQACSRFVYLDKLYVAQNPKPAEKRKVENSPQLNDDLDQSMTDIDTIREEIREIIKNNSDDDGLLLSSTLGNLLRKTFPDFDSRNYGFDKLVNLIDNLDIIEKRNLKVGNSQKSYLHFRLKDDQ